MIYSFSIKDLIDEILLDETLAYLLPYQIKSAEIKSWTLKFGGPQQITPFLYLYNDSFLGEISPTSDILLIDGKVLNVMKILQEICLDKIYYKQNNPSISYRIKNIEFKRIFDDILFVLYLEPLKNDLYLFSTMKMFNPHETIVIHEPKFNIEKFL